MHRRPPGFDPAKVGPCTTEFWVMRDQLSLTSPLGKSGLTLVLDIENTDVMIKGAVIPAPQYLTQRNCLIDLRTPISNPLGAFHSLPW